LNGLSSTFYRKEVIEMRVMMLIALMLMIAAQKSEAQAVASTPQPDTAVTCSVHRLTELGYTVESANKDFGLVKATKRQEGTFVTTINVVQQGVGKLDVKTKLTNEDRDWRTGTVRSQDLGEGTKYTKADAQTVRQSCGSS
jgi:hypothetical protein